MELWREFWPGEVFWRFVKKSCKANKTEEEVYEMLDNKRRSLWTCTSFYSVIGSDCKPEQRTSIVRYAR